jgi:acetyl esterase/lipase
VTLPTRTTRAGRADLANRVSDLKASVLMLHGTADSAADGGMTDVQMARTFEATLRRVGAPVEARYYPGGRYNGSFADPQQYKDELQRIRSFAERRDGADEGRAGTSPRPPSSSRGVERTL